MKRGDFGTALAARADLVERRIRELVGARSGIPVSLKEAMLYSLTAGGKRLRPALCLEAAAVCGDDSAALDSACALEMVHTYSLIHDDLPAMDDDDLRRGRPSCHKAFGEATAILAGDALLTMAFEVVSAAEAVEPGTRSELVRELAEAAGPEGMVAGQVLDMEGEGGEPSEEALFSIHRNKTMRLIRAAVRMGVKAVGGEEETLRALSEWGENAGLAFQVADDILDEVSTPEQLGKTPGKDREASKVSAVRVWGLDGARRKAEEFAGRAVEALEGLGEKAWFFREAAEFFVRRLG